MTFKSQYENAKFKGSKSNKSLIYQKSYDQESQPKIDNDEERINLRVPAKSQMSKRIQKHPRLKNRVNRSIEISMIYDFSFSCISEV